MKRLAARHTAYLLIGLLPLAFFVVQHEMTHMYFAEEHNCSNITVHGPDLGDGTAASVTYNAGSCNRPELLTLKQEMVESVGYQKMPQLVFLGLVLALMIDISLRLQRIDQTHL